MNSAINYSSLESAEFSHIFVPLDGTEWHEQAISYGLLLSEWFESKIDLFFSLADLPPLRKQGEWEQRAQVTAPLIETPAIMDRSSSDHNGAHHEFGKILAYDYLGEITKRLEHLEFDIDVDVAAGSPAHILTYKAQTAGDAMIVMYARPQSRFNRYFTRKMGEQLMSVTTVPVMMLNEGAQKVNHFREMAPESIILPQRNRSAMKAALPIVSAIASKSGARIELLSRKSLRQGREQSEVDALVGWFESKGFEARVTFYEGDTCKAVVESEKRSGMAWVVLGSRMRRGVTRSIFPSLADNVRREVSSPVIVAPREELLPKRKSAVERWLLEWRATQNETEMEASQYKSSSRPVSVPNALIFFRDGDAG